MIIAVGSHSSTQPTNLASPVDDTTTPIQTTITKTALLKTIKEEPSNINVKSTVVYGIAGQNV